MYLRRNGYRGPQLNIPLLKLRSGERNQIICIAWFHKNLFHPLALKQSWCLYIITVETKLLDIALNPILKTLNSSEAESVSVFSWNEKKERSADWGRIFLSTHLSMFPSFSIPHRGRDRSSLRNMWIFMGDGNCPKFQSGLFVMLSHTWWKNYRHYDKRSVKLITYRHLVPILIMSGAVPLLRLLLRGKRFTLPL